MNQFLRRYFQSRFLTLKTPVPAYSDRDSCDKNVRDFKIKLRKELTKTVSVIYRVKNGEAFLELSIASVIPIATEIILVDNNSDDRTELVFKKLNRKYPDISFRYFKDNETYANAGSSYQLDLKNGYPSLADFYNKSFSLGSCDYLMKMDAHYLLMPSCLPRIVKLLNANNKYLTLQIIDIYGRIQGGEPLIFKNQDWVFEDGKNFEELRLTKKTILEKIFSLINGNCVLHLKRLNF